MRIPDLLAVPEPAFSFEFFPPKTAEGVDQLFATADYEAVSVYRARVLEKLGLSNNSEMTVYAIRHGLVGGE